MRSRQATFGLWTIVGCAALAAAAASWSVPSSQVAHAQEEIPLGEKVPLTQTPHAIAICGPACERPIGGVDCLFGGGCREAQWSDWGPIPWQALSQGEYIGPARAPHVPDYRLRVDDEIEFVYALNRQEESAYRLQVGDALRISSRIDPAAGRDVTIQPDGTIDLYLLGPVQAARLTVDELKDLIDQRYKKFYKVSDFSIQRTHSNTRLLDIRDAVDNREFAGGQGRRVRVTPEGTVSLPEIGGVYLQGLSLDEASREVNERYAQVVSGLSVTPILVQPAPRHLFVVGEVKRPGRYLLESPTTVMGAISLAGGWKNGANLRQIVVFRRAEDWRLLATKIDIRDALYGKRPTPADEIFLRDSDVVVVPKTSLKTHGDLMQLVFTRGIYRIFPVIVDAEL